MQVKFKTNVDSIYGHWVFPKIPLETAIHINKGDLIKCNWSTLKVFQKIYTDNDLIIELCPIDIHESEPDVTDIR